MMAAVRRAFPCRLLAAGRPLAPHPPATHLFRLCRIFKVDDCDNVAQISVELGRAVYVAAVERETMHAARRPGADMPRIGRRAYVEDFQPAFEIGVLPA